MGPLTSFRTITHHGPLPPCPTRPPHRSHLESTYDSQETQADLELLRQLAAEDAQAGRTVPPIP